MTNPASPAAGEDRFEFTVCCSGEKSMLRILRRFVTDVAGQMGFTDEDLVRIELAVDEACANVACHAYRPQEPRENRLELRLRRESRALVIHVRDYGAGAGAPEEIRGAASLEDYQRPDRDGYDGLGLLIIRKFMDEVSIQTRPGAGTTIVMRKLLPPGSG